MFDSTRGDWSLQNNHRLYGIYYILYYFTISCNNIDYYPRIINDLWVITNVIHCYINVCFQCVFAVNVDISMQFGQGMMHYCSIHTEELQIHTTISYAVTIDVILNLSEKTFYRLLRVCIHWQKTIEGPWKASSKFHKLKTLHVLLCTFSRLSH